MKTIAIEPDTDTDTESDPTATPVPPESANRRSRYRARAAVLVAALLAIAAVGSWAYLFVAVRPADHALTPERQQAAVDTAATATAAILSYKSDTVDADLEAANSMVTGSFGDYYRTFTRDVVSPAAKQKKISTSATVVGKAISAFSEDTATVIVFVNQSTTTAENTQPTATSAAIRIELERDGETWLVSKFDPA